MKGIHLIFILSIISQSLLLSQVVVKRNTQVSKEEANLNWSKEYTLFDYITDEPIFPLIRNGQNVYKIYYASKEDPRPTYGELSIAQVENLKYYKFKNREFCLKFSLANKLNTVPTLITSVISSITPTTSSSGGTISSDGGAAVTSRGVVWSTSPNPTITLTTKTNNGTGMGSFTSSLSGLTPSTTYYVRAYATNSAGTGYGNEITFTTSTPVVLPTISTISASSITTTSATTGGNISSDGGASITARGVVWSTSTNPTITLSTKTSNGTGTGSFTSSLSGLTPRTTYYVRAYATNSAGTGYGNEVTFSTSNSSAVMNIPCPGTPSVKDIDGNTYNTVQIGTQCWTKENLKVSKYRNGNAIPTGLNNTTWSSTTSGAYAIYDNDNANDAVYGKLYNWYAVADTKGLCPTGWHVPNDSEWTTLSNFLGFKGGKMKSITGWKAPNRGATNESGFSALPGGMLNSNGNFSDIISFAMFWSTLGSFGSAMSYNLDYDEDNVQKWTNYKQNGLSVRCLNNSSITIPVLTTNTITAITSTSATTGGNITTDGGETVTAIGVVWSTNANPTISLSTKNSEEPRTGDFSSYLKGLLPNTTYYVRAYATNSVGTGYGNEVTFTTRTLADLPTLVTTYVNSITPTTSSSGGTISSDGGAAVTLRGVVWSTSPNPTITLTTKTNNGTGTGSFTSNLTNLTPKTTYYVRAYATNSSGTAYGNEISFTTVDSSMVMNIPCPGTPSVKDIDGNTYNTVQIGTQCWTKENLKVSKYRNGEAIPSKLDNAAWFNTTRGAYAIYDNDDYFNNGIYGKLYNWYAVNDPRILCPTGWHIPQDKEWTTLIKFLGGESEAGGKLKSKYTGPNGGWNSPNKDATNSSGFTALPGGTRSFFGSFSLKGDIGFFWSSTEKSFSGAGGCSLYDYNGFAYTSGEGDKRNGYSVRCIKD